MMIPFHAEAERGVLCCMFLEPDGIGDLMDAGLTSDSFHEPNHRMVASCLMDSYDQGLECDEFVIADRLQKAGFNEDAIPYVLDLGTVLDTTTQLDSLLEIVLEKAALRKLHGLAHEITDNITSGEGTSVELCGFAEQTLEVLNNSGKDTTFLEPRQQVEEFTSDLKELEEARGKTGVMTGIRGLDYILNGLKPTEMYVLGARPATGKTALALQISWEASHRQRVPTLFHSLEMSRRSLRLRLCAHAASIPMDAFREGFFSDQQRQGINNFKAQLTSAPLYIDDRGGLTVADIRRRARRLSSRGLGLLVVDYCQIIQPRDRRTVSRERQIGEISESFRNLAKELNIAVLLLCQLNRDVERTGREPRLSDLRESGSIEQDADVVAFLSRTPDDDTILRVAKNRHGKCGSVSLNLVGHLQQFQEISA